MIVLDDFNKKFESDGFLWDKYRSVVLDSLIDLWKEYGFGSFYEDLIKLINPDEYREIVEKTYYRGNKAIPILITCLGDVIVWEDNDHLTLIQYRDFKYVRLADSIEDFFDKLSRHELDQLLDKKYYDDVVYCGAYVDYDVCFVQRPMVLLGGTKDPFRMYNIQIDKFLNVCDNILGVVGGERRYFGNNVPKEYELYFGHREEMKLSRSRFLSEMRQQDWEKKMYYSICIDAAGPSQVGFMYGCFYDSGKYKWIVYQTGERGDITGEEAFDAEEYALGELKYRILEEIRQHPM